MKIFGYVKPSNAKEALDLLNVQGTRAKIIAGGTDVLQQMRAEKINSAMLVDISDLTEFQGIRISDGKLHIGALTTVRNIERSGEIAKSCPLLQEAAKVLGSRQIRNVATIGGNICNASPSADLIPALMVLGADLVIQRQEGSLIKQIDQFFLGPSNTVLSEQPGILSEIVIAELPNYSGASYIKLSPRKALDLAVVGVAALVMLDETENRCKEVRIALGAVGPTPLRAYKAEELFKSAWSGSGLSAALIDNVAKEASQEAKPITDVRATVTYRRQMIRVLVKRALDEAIARAISAAGGETYAKTN